MGVGGLARTCVCGLVDASERGRSSGADWLLRALWALETGCEVGPVAVGAFLDVVLYVVLTDVVGACAAQAVQGFPAVVWLVEALAARTLHRLWSRRVGRLHTVAVVVKHQPVCQQMI